MSGPDHDPVHSPSHYTKGGIECIDAIEAALGPVRASGFRAGNAMKYIYRAGDKGDYIEDMQKAKWYLDREIEKAIQDRTASRPEPASVGSPNEEAHASPHPDPVSNHPSSIERDFAPGGPVTRTLH